VLRKKNVDASIGIWSARQHNAHRRRPVFLSDDQAESTLALSRRRQLGVAHDPGGKRSDNQKVISAHLFGSDAAKKKARSDVRAFVKSKEFSIAC